MDSERGKVPEVCRRFAEICSDQRALNKGSGALKNNFPTTVWAKNCSLDSNCINLQISKCPCSMRPLELFQPNAIVDRQPF